MQSSTFDPITQLRQGPIRWDITEALANCDLSGHSGPHPVVPARDEMWSGYCDPPDHVLDLAIACIQRSVELTVSHTNDRDFVELTHLNEYSVDLYTVLDDMPVRIYLELQDYIKELNHTDWTQRISEIMNFVRCRWEFQRDWVTVVVTESHIRKGVQNCRTQCPIAHAFEHATGLKCTVDSAHIEANGRYYYLPARVQYWMRDFDNNQPTEPIHFTCAAEKEG